MRTLKLPCLGALALAAAALATNAAAEYRPYSAEGFETRNGRWPEAMLHGHSSSPYTTQLVDLYAPSMPQDILSGAAPSLLDQYALRFAPTDQDPHLSITHSGSLDRARLGPSGAALFQVDVFLGPLGEPQPTMAILARARNDQGGNEGIGSYRFYRFGLEADRVYFSFTNATPSPVVYVKQDIAEFNLKRPGWHRLQMIFKGTEDIYCAIDGQMSTFSPIKDSTLNVIAPGVMMTQSKNNTGIGYADNLSVMWTNNNNDPLPGSPWNTALGKDGASGGIPKTWNDTKLPWFTSPSEAWRQAQTDKRPILAVFHDNNFDSTQYLIEMLTTPTAQQNMQHVVPLRVDVSQPGGPKIAESFRAPKAPCFMLISKEMAPLAQAPVVVGQTTWDQVIALLARK